jgi:hypothetical protein
MKNKELIFEFKNDWQHLIGKYNWYSFTLLEFSVEHENWLKAFSLQFTLLGLGVYIRLNWDVKFLEKKIKSWDDREFITEVEYKIEEYAKKVMEEGAGEMSDVYIGKMNAISDIKKLLADKDEKLMDSR